MSLAASAFCNGRDRGRAVVRRACALALLFCALGAPSLLAQVTREYDLKAVLIYNFIQFVEWPRAAFPRADAPFVIGVVGTDPFGRALDTLASQSAEDGRRIVVMRFRTIEAARSCQILFVSASEQDRLPQILTALHGLPVLTVGDFESFAAHGGMIRFVKTPENKLRLRINLEAVKAGGLNISAKLLRIADVVRGTPD